jgi:long-subunit acyl-CoA synthetase (AMP-forming)
LSSLPDNGSRGKNIEPATLENLRLACDDLVAPVCTAMSNQSRNVPF